MSKIEKLLASKPVTHLEQELKALGLYWTHTGCTYGNGGNIFLILTKKLIQVFPSLEDRLNEALIQGANSMKGEMATYCLSKGVKTMREFLITKEIRGIENTIHRQGGELTPSGLIFDGETPFVLEFSVNETFFDAIITQKGENPFLFRSTKEVNRIIQESLGDPDSSSSDGLRHRWNGRRLPDE